MSKAVKTYSSIMRPAARFLMALLLLAALAACAAGSYRPAKTSGVQDLKTAFEPLAQKMRRAFEHAEGCEEFNVGLRGFSFSGRFVKEAGFLRTPQPRRFRRGVFDDRTLQPAQTEVWEQRVVIFDEVVDIEAKNSLFGFSPESSGCPIPGRRAKSVVIISTKRGRVCIGFGNMAAARDFADAVAGMTQ